MKKLLSFVVAILVIATLLCTAVLAAKDPLDEIQNYTISVDMLPDGDAKIVYHFDWKVLDSESEGPLEYLFVGIPNSHVANITALSDNIKSIKYTSSSDNGSGHFVRIDFYRKYYKDEVFSFDFSIEQGYLYILNDDGTVEFGFTPGWFPGIAIKNMEVLWNGIYVVDSNCDYIDENNCLVWQTSLSSGEDEKMACNVLYKQERFEQLDAEKQATNAESGTGGTILLAILGILFLVVIIGAIIAAIIAVVIDDGYDGGGGRSRGGGGSVFISSCARSSCVHSCACASCACACACAGGGRAGCSAKNIYGADVQMIQKATKDY